MDRAGVEWVLVIAREIESAGRRSDAELLARLAAEAGAEFEPDLPADELDRRLNEAEADIPAGLITANENVWAEIDGARAGRPSSNPSRGPSWAVLRQAH